MKNASLKSVLGASLVLAALSASVSAAEAPKSTSVGAGQAEIKKELNKDTTIKIKDNTHQIKTMKDGTRCEFKGL